MGFDILKFIAPVQTADTDIMKDIDICNISPSNENFYDVSEIKELADAILQVGLMQNLVVEPIADDKYEVISGHRRRLALISLVESGHDEFKTVNCKVMPRQTNAMSELRLILANSTTRVLSEYEKTQQAVRLKAILTEIKSDGIKLNGRMRDIIADNLNVSPTKVAQMETVNKNLPPEYHDDFKSGKMNFTTALKLSQGKEDKPPKIKKIRVYDSLLKMSLPELAECIYDIADTNEVTKAEIIEWLESYVDVGKQ